MEVNMNNYFKVLFFLSLVSGLSATKDKDLEKLSAAFKSKATISRSSNPSTTLRTSDSSSEGYNSEDLPGASDEDEGSSCPSYFEVETQTEPEEEAVVWVSEEETQTQTPLVYCKPILAKFSDELKTLIANSTNLKACFFRFTLYDVAQAIVTRAQTAPNLGALIVNQDFQTDHCEALKLLVTSGFNCFKCTPSGDDYSHMHVKFCILKNATGKLLWSGSWNCTGQANEKNIEAVTLTNDPNTIDAFEGLFKSTLRNTYTKKIKEADCTSSKKVTPGSKRGCYMAKKLNKIPDDAMEKEN